MKMCPCGSPSRPGAAYCYPCHAAYMRKWRKTHPLSEEARAKMNARCYLHVYIRRGILKRQPCVLCGTFPAEPHHHDYSKPLEVTWLCRAHHLALEGKKVRKEKPDYLKPKKPHAASPSGNIGGSSSGTGSAKPSLIASRAPSF